MAGQLAASIATARASGFPPFVLDVRGNDRLGDAGVRVLADEMEAGGALSLCGVGATLDSEGVLDMGWQVMHARHGVC